MTDESFQLRRVRKQEGQVHQQLEESHRQDLDKAQKSPIVASQAGKPAVAVATEPREGSAGPGLVRPSCSAPCCPPETQPEDDCVQRGLGQPPLTAFFRF